MDHFTIKHSAASVTASIQPKQYQRYFTPANTTAEQLPAYSEVVKDSENIKVVEKEIEVAKPQKQSKLAAIKSIVKGDDGSNKQPDSHNGWKAIVTGDVHKYHPMYRLDESMSGQMRYNSG